MIKVGDEVAALVPVISIGDVIQVAPHLQPRYRELCIACTDSGGREVAQIVSAGLRADATAFAEHGFHVVRSLPIKTNQAAIDPKQQLVVDISERNVVLAGTD